MASLTPTKKQIEEMALLLNSDFPSATEAAKMALHLAWSMYAERAKYMIVAALATAEDTGEHDAKVICVGPYQSATTAKNAALSTQLAEVAEWRWVVPIYGGTPGQLLIERTKAKQAEADAERDAKKYAWLIPLAERDKLREDLGRFKDGEIEADELFAKYSDQAWDDVLALWQLEAGASTSES